MKRQRFVFDIETVPLPPDKLAEFAPAEEEIKTGNLKDPLKIEAKRLEIQNRFLEKAALSALTGRIAAIGIMGPDRPDGEIDMRTDFGAEEKLIRWLFDYLTPADDVWIGFNIAAFDVPFLMRRAWHLGIDIPRGLVRGRYLSNRFIDLAEIWRASVYEKELVSLDRLGRFLGIGGKTGDGAGFAGLLYSDQEAASAYLRNDLFLTWRIAERFGLVGKAAFESEPEADPFLDRESDKGSVAPAKREPSPVEELAFW